MRAKPRPDAGSFTSDGAAGDGHPSQWLLITVSLTAGQASLRVHVWRKLRSLGSVYLQSSVCLLPDQPQVLREVRRLLDRVHHEGGSGRFLRIALSEADEAEALRAEFNAAREDEYAEVLERLPALEAEIAMERSRGRATYAEVEESEADLERFHSWLRKIAQRDYFAALGGEQARARVAEVAEQLAVFEEEALNAEAPAGDRSLRAVAPRRRGKASGDSP